jgi:hypothetical protein
MGIDGTSIMEMSAYLDHAIATSSIRQAFIEIDPINFGMWHRPDYSPDRLLRVSSENNYPVYYFNFLADKYFELFSLLSLEASAKSFLRGTQITAYSSFKKDVLSRALSTYNQYALVLEKGNTMRELDQILALSNDHYIELILYIPPLHESAYYTRNWERFEKWQRDILSSITTFNKETGSNVSLWDFSGFNSINSTPIQSSTYSLRFGDPLHMSKATGKMLLDRMLDTCSTPCSIPEDFGIRLSADNIEKFLNEQRIARQRYIEH